MKNLLNRREFLKKGSILSLGAGVAPYIITCANAMKLEQGSTSGKGYVSQKEITQYYAQKENKRVQCLICPRNCVLERTQRSFCQTRKNINGKLYTLVYGNPCAVHIDPVEKNPLFHFFPQSDVFTIGTAGCMMKCQCCQNWQISQLPPEETTNFSLSPKAVIKAAIRNKCKVIGYTYTEPTNFFEYMLDVSKLAKENGLKNIYHSNGFINPEPLKELCKYIDGACIDLKGFNNYYYHSMTQGWLEPVLNTLKILKKEDIHLEIVNLIIPTKNDSTELVKEMALWIKNELGDNTPLHLARFYPYYKLLHLPPTSISILEALRNTAKEAGLKYVYLGNVPGHPAEYTYCPKCNKIMIKRFGFQVIENNLHKNKCKFCQEPIAGLWQ